MTEKETELIKAVSEVEVLKAQDLTKCSKLSKIKLSLLLISMLMFTACASNYHGFDFNSSSNSQCAVSCESLMYEYYCMEATPSYLESFTNGDQTKGLCSCFVRRCGK